MASAHPPKRPTAKRPATKRAPATPSRKPRKAPVTRKAAAGFSTTTAFSIGAIVVAAGAALTGFFARRQIAAWAEFPTEGHRADDLMGDTRPTAADRAPDHFRPDPTAPVSAADRAALRPA